MGLLVNKPSYIRWLCMSFSCLVCSAFLFLGKYLNMFIFFKIVLLTCEMNWLGGYYRGDKGVWTPPSWEKHGLSPSNYCKHNCIIVNNIMICTESTCTNYRCRKVCFYVLKDCVPPHMPNIWVVWSTGPHLPAPCTLVLEHARTTLKWSSCQLSGVARCFCGRLTHHKRKQNILWEYPHFKYLVESIKFTIYLFKFSNITITKLYPATYSCKSVVPNLFHLFMSCELNQKVIFTFQTFLSEWF